MKAWRLFILQGGTYFQRHTSISARCVNWYEFTVIIFCVIVIISELSSRGTPQRIASKTPQRMVSILNFTIMSGMTLSLFPASLPIARQPCRAHCQHINNYRSSAFIASELSSPFPALSLLSKTPIVHQ